MGGQVTKHQHNHVYQQDPSIDDSSSTGFHIFELHISTVKYGLTTLLLLVFFLVVGYFLWRRCRRNVQRRQWRRLFESQSFRPNSLFGYRLPPYGGSTNPAGGLEQAPPARPSIIYPAQRYTAAGNVRGTGISPGHGYAADSLDINDTDTRVDVLRMDKYPLPEI